MFQSLNMCLHWFVCVLCPHIFIEIKMSGIYRACKSDITLLHFPASVIIYLGLILHVKKNLTPLSATKGTKDKVSFISWNERIGTKLLFMPSKHPWISVNFTWVHGCWGRAWVKANVMYWSWSDRFLRFVNQIW